MSIDWAPLAGLIERSDRFLVTTHVRPDGDALGSEVGMAGLLRQKGKDVRVVNTSLTPPRYDFLDPSGTLFEHYAGLADPEELRHDRTLIVLDLSAWNQLGDMAEFVRAFPGPRLVIDHHLGDETLGAVVLKDVTAEATGLLVLEAARAMGVAIDQTMAEGILTAIAMDTGWFRHTSTRPRTLRAAAELMESGARIDHIYRKIFERNTLARIRLMGEALARMRTAADGRIAYTTIASDDFARTGAIPADSEDVVDQTASVRGVELGILFVEQPRGGIRVSMRARNGLDCSRLARSLGGGGHRAAAAASIDATMPETVEKVLAAASSALDDFQKTV